MDAPVSCARHRSINRSTLLKLARDVQTIVFGRADWKAPELLTSSLMLFRPTIAGLAHFNSTQRLREGQTMSAIDSPMSRCLRCKRAFLMHCILGLVSVHVLLSEHGLANEPNKATSEIQFKILDDSGKLLPCRVHLKNDIGEPQRAAGMPFWRDHFVCSGQVDVEVLAGKYAYEIERGPEHKRLSGTVAVEAGKRAVVEATLTRIAKLRDEGWFSGDMHVHRPVAEIEQLMLAEDLDFAPVITWWNARNPWRDAAIPNDVSVTFDGHRHYTIMAGEDEREGGALLYYGLQRPVDLSVKSREFPSPMQFVADAREQVKDVWIDIEKPFWWDVPTWLASGQMNSIGLANNHMCHSRMYESEAWGRPRDAERLPIPLGNGFWTQEIYYHMLNAGLRLPPSAGSASGVLPNPVGYNRVYVHLDKPFSREAWFESLSRGRCFVTNGPLLRVSANDQLPGAILNLADDRPLEIKLSIKLTSNDRVPFLEVIHNGRIVKTIDCSPGERGENVLQRTATILVSEPGWFLVRAISDVDHTFRFASTAPWYVESKTIDRRISRRSAQMFLDWVNERIDRVQKNVTDADQLRAVLEPHEKARVFWLKQVQQANADLEGSEPTIEQTSNRASPVKVTK